MTERADNALSHRLLSPRGDMGTDDFVFTQKGIQIRRVFESWSPSVEESNYVLHSWGGSLFESVPGVLGWSWVSEIEKELVIVLYEALSHIKRPNNKWHLVSKLLWRILIGNPLDLMQLAFLWCVLWLIKTVFRSKLWLSLELFCENDILFLSITWFTVRFCHRLYINKVSAQQVTTLCNILCNIGWISALKWRFYGACHLLASLRWTEWLHRDERSIINLCGLWSPQQSIYFPSLQEALQVDNGLF